MRWRALDGCLLVVALALPVVALAPAPADAQTRWSSRQYGDWIDEGTSLYDEAMALPPEALERRHELLRESARVKLLARAMLRAAIVSGAVDSFRDSAIGEYFNLCENLIVHLATLDQCEASALLIEQVEADEAILPPDGVAYLGRLEPTLAECRARVARPNPGWELERFLRLVADADAWREQAAEVDGDDAIAARFEAAQSEQEALDALREALLGYGRADGLDAPAEQLFAQYPRLVEDLVALGQCEVARRRVAQWRFDAELLGASAPPESAGCRE